MPLLEAKSYKLNLGEERAVGIWEGTRLQDETSKEALNNQEILQPSKDNNINNNVKQKANKSYSQSVQKQTPISSKPLGVPYGAKLEVTSSKQKRDLMIQTFLTNDRRGDPGRNEDSS